MYIIRHGIKMWNNGKNKYLSHDPPLDKNYIYKIYDIRNKLLNDFEPNCILSSPFLRCRQTAEILSNNNIPIYIDPLLREYLGNWKNIQFNNLDDITYNYLSNVKIVETFDELKSRVEILKQQLKNINNVWVVTHGIIINLLTDKKLNEAEYIKYG